MDRLVFAIYRALSALFCALPLTAVFRIGWALGALGYWIAGPYRRLVLHNLGIAFGREKSPAELRAIARKHFATLGANICAGLKLARMPGEEILKHVTVEGLEMLEPGLIARGHFIVALGHFGNWELLAQLFPLIFACKGGATYQALGNPYIDADFQRARARMGIELFDKKEGFSKVIQFLRADGVVGSMVDQHAGDSGLWCPFFGRLASTSPLLANIALRTKSPIVSVAVFTEKGCRWRWVIRGQINPDSGDVATITMRLNEVIEEYVRQQPFDWFWVHNRWKTPQPKFLLATYKRGLAGIQNPLQPFRILIRASNWLGDAIMSVPAVRAIKRGRPDAHLSVLTPAKLADLWKSVAEVDEVIAIEPGENVFAVAKKLRAQNFDAAVIFPNSLRTALEVWLARIPRRVGVPGHRRRWLLDKIFEPKKKKKQAAPRPRHQVHDYLALAEFIGADVGSMDGGLLMVDSPRGTAGLHHPPSTTHHPRPIIGLCPGAEYGPAKRWLPERFAETMRAVHEKTGCEWKLFGVEKDRPVADTILTAAAIPVTDLIGKTTHAQLMDELRTCDLLLTNDTGTMHLAAHLAVPTVALFGSTEPALTGPLGSQHRIIRHHVECSPCFLRECPIDFRCMKAIEVSEVVAAVDGVLKDQRASG